MRSSSISLSAALLLGSGCALFFTEEDAPSSGGAGGDGASSQGEPAATPAAARVRAAPRSAEVARPAAVAAPAAQDASAPTKSGSCPSRTRSLGTSRPARTGDTPSSVGPSVGPGLLPASIGERLFVASVDDTGCDVQAFDLGPKPSAAPPSASSAPPTTLLSLSHGPQPLVAWVDSALELLTVAPASEPSASLFTCDLSNHPPTSLSIATQGDQLFVVFTSELSGSLECGAESQFISDGSIAVRASLDGTSIQLNAIEDNAVRVRLASGAPLRMVGHCDGGSVPGGGSCSQDGEWGTFDAALDPATLQPVSGQGALVALDPFVTIDDTTTIFAAASGAAFSFASDGDGEHHFGWRIAGTQYGVSANNPPTFAFRPGIRSAASLSSSSLLLTGALASDVGSIPCPDDCGDARPFWGVANEVSDLTGRAYPILEDAAADCALPAGYAAGGAPTGGPAASSVVFTGAFRCGKLWLDEGLEALASGTAQNLFIARVPRP